MYGVFVFLIITAHSGSYNPMGKFAPTNMENLYRVAVNGPAKTQIPHTLHSRYMRSNNVDNNDNNNNNCVRDGIFSSRAELAQSPLYAVIRMSVRTEFTFFAHPNAVIDGQITFLTFVQFGRCDFIFRTPGRQNALWCRVANNRNDTFRLNTFYWNIMCVYSLRGVYIVRVWMCVLQIWFDSMCASGTIYSCWRSLLHYRIWQSVNRSTLYYTQR